MYDLDFLCWVNRCLFKEDFRKELIDQGVGEFLATELSKHTDKGILGIYQEFIMDEEVKEVLTKYLDNMLK